ncbi:MAG: cell division protein ZapA [Gammaproteobacteria bacterium]|nr:cell division protein ZapA [Gammaproteobacteria bacterium]
MNAESEQVGFRLLKKTYEVGCPPDRRKSLDEAIKFLKAQVQKVHDADATAGMDRVAVVTALNLSHEYLRLSKGTPDHLLERIDALSARVQKALDRVEEANLT